MLSSNKSMKSRKTVKRKSDANLDSSNSDISNTDIHFENTSRQLWSTYSDIYDIIAVTPSEVQTTEECVAHTRVIDVATRKLIDDVQRLELSAIDLWSDIAKRIVNNWNSFFHETGNMDDWSLGDLIPLNRFKSNCFGLKSLLIKRNNPEKKPAESQKRQRTRRKEESSETKMAKPIEGFHDDKPPFLMEHMECIKSVLKKLSKKNEKSISYMRLVLNPTSFSSTVYNIFALAFLVREGMVMITIGSDDEPIVQLLNASLSASVVNDNRKKYNFLVSLTTEEWKILVKKLDITFPLIPSPRGFEEEDQFYERFTQMSQKEKRKENR